jgi:hypothetical protein
LSEGGDAALKKFKAFVEREAKGFRLGAEVGVKCTGGETGLLCQAIHADAAEPAGAEAAPGGFD